eukprot:CAMPEP_0181314180 /NCGR_PEP_ID=MMETSP1101-20121128/14671_1 /TAXON_ID=46948 /ORGANISM="Rhodomonas abbreviata, Strain Caron Lab Isolate" /LENGTH=969 /DNA_ID=CAMNT_0023421237 /DNA_START=41 /DNA_END=2947 /DNA_ORIENTATION=+
MTITFVATSNKNLKRMEFWGDETTLQQAIEQSKPFGGAFAKEKGADSGLFPPGLFPPHSTTSDGLIVQSSSEPEAKSVQSRLGLISAVTDAYNSHLDLVLDPNDFWITIVAQFSAYINGGDRAESLRDSIVDFDGKKTLTVTAAGTLFTTDFGRMTVSMVDEIAQNIKDPSLREWFLPGFSTSTTNDKICASVACMSALQNYFDYRFCLACGIPNVTLRGTVSDWKLLRSKIERLLEFDLDDKLMSAWLKLLRPICDNLVGSAEGKPKVAFWDQICCHLGGGSGPRYLSGWITAFSVFSTNGRWQGRSGSAESGHESDAPHSGDGPATTKAAGTAVAQDDTNDLNHNQMSVPVTIDDNGKEYKATLFAGQFIFESLENGAHPAVRPRNDWAIAIPASREAILEGLVFPTWSGTAAANDSERGEEESVAKTVSKTRPLDDMETMDTNADGATGCHERPECSGQASLSASLSTPGATSSGAMTELEQKDSSPAPGAAHVGQPDSASSPPSPFPPPSSPVSRASSLLDVAGCQSRMPQKNENKANVPPRRQFSARQLSASILTPSHNLHSCHRNVDAAPVEAPMETEWEAERRMETEWEAEAEAEGEGEGEAAAAAAAAAAAEAGEQGNSSETVVPAGVGVEASEPPSPLAAATGAHPGAVVPQAEEERGAEEEGNINVCVVSNVAGRVKGVVARLFSLMGVAKRGNSKQTGRAKAGKGKVAQGPGVAAEGPRRSPRLQRTRVQARAVSMTRAMSRAVSLARSMSEAAASDTCECANAGPLRAVSGEREKEQELEARRCARASAKGERHLEDELETVWVQEQRVSEAFRSEVTGTGIVTGTRRAERKARSLRAAFESAGGSVPAPPADRWSRAQFHCATGGQLGIELCSVSWAGTGTVWRFGWQLEQQEGGRGADALQAAEEGTRVVEDDDARCKGQGRDTEAAAHLTHPGQSFELQVLSASDSGLARAGDG